MHCQSLGWRRGGARAPGRKLAGGPRCSCRSSPQSITIGLFSLANLAMNFLLKYHCPMFNTVILLFHAKDSSALLSSSDSALPRRRGPEGAAQNRPPNRATAPHARGDARELGPWCVVDAS